MKITFLSAFILTIVLNGCTFKQTEIEPVENGIDAEQEAIDVNVEIKNNESKTNETNEPVADEKVYMDSDENCTTVDNKKGYLKVGSDGSEDCYAIGEVIRDTDCLVSKDGGCEPMEKALEQLVAGDKCTTEEGNLGYVKQRPEGKKCFAVGEIIPDTGCILTEDGGCKITNGS